MSEPESQSDNCNVICPYCLHEYQAEAEDYNEDEREEECESCGKTYLRSDQCDITYYTKPKDQAK